MKKTNAARILDKLNIKYETAEYEVDESDLSAPAVAAKIGQPVERVFKTLVLRGDKSGVIVACVPGELELNLKSLAQLSSNKKVEMVQMKEIQELTGYIRGGVSPVGMKKNYPAYVDESALRFDHIFVSAGIRGMQLKICPKDLLAAVNAVTGKITQVVEADK